MEEFDDLVEFDTRENHLRIVRQAIESLKSPDKELMEDVLAGKTPEEIVKKHKFKSIDHFYKQKFRYKNKLKK